ncbi:MAG TPA: hypothetical protein VF884_13040 [Nitrososphaeraceae archaeon]
MRSIINSYSTSLAKEALKLTNDTDDTFPGMIQLVSGGISNTNANFELKTKSCI